jgi:hypothetical protein
MKLNSFRFAKLKQDRYDELIKKSPPTYYEPPKKKPRISLKNLFHLPVCPKGYKVCKCNPNKLKCVKK